MNVIRIAAAAAATVAIMVSHTGFAQQKVPAKPVTIVVPYPPGGSNDTLARKLQLIPPDESTLQ